MTNAVSKTWSLLSKTFNPVEEMAVSGQFESYRASRRRTLRCILYHYYLIIAHLVCTRFFPVINNVVT